MRDWMNAQGFDSQYLRWYVDYACRDEYGGAMGDISAWAGLYYFAAHARTRRQRAHHAAGRQWLDREAPCRETPALSQNKRARRRNPKNGIEDSRLDAGHGIHLRHAHLRGAVACSPSTCMEDAPPVTTQYSPWVTANLTLDRMPRERGLDLAWDNVIYDSQSLGYVVATHMSLRRESIDPSGRGTRRVNDPQECS